MKRSCLRQTQLRGIHYLGYPATSALFLGLVEVYLIHNPETPKMLFGLLLKGEKHSSSPPVPLRIKLRDDSLITAYAEDTDITFSTSFGEPKVNLSNINRMRYVASLHTLKGLSQFNKFRVWCKDGNRIVGVPKSPVRLRVQLNGDSRSNMKIKFIDIQAMKALTRR